MDSFLFFSSLLFFLWRWSGPPWTPQTWLHALPYLWLFKNTHTHTENNNNNGKKREKQQQDVIDLRAKTTLFINRFFFSAYFFKKWPIIKKEFFFFFLTLDIATWWIAERYSVYVKERKNFYPSLIDFLFISLFVQLYRCRGPWREIYPFSVTQVREPRQFPTTRDNKVRKKRSIEKYLPHRNSHYNRSNRPKKKKTFHIGLNECV